MSALTEPLHSPEYEDTAHEEHPQRTRLDTSGGSDGSSFNAARIQEEKNHAVAVSSAELFFDLIFVAVTIEIGQSFKDHVDWSGCATTFGLFTVFWLTWFHTNLLLTRFHMRRTRAVVVFAIILSSLLVAANAVEDDSDVSGDEDSKTRTVYLILMGNRMIFLGSYVSIWFARPETRPMLSRYIVGFVVSCVLFLVGGLVNEQSRSVYFAVSGILTEIITYPLALSIKEEDKLAINNEHILERNHLWVILILGESIISLITTEHNDFKNKFYYVEVLGLILVYFLLIIHTKSQVFLREVHGLEYRPIPYLLSNLSLLVMTSGLLGVGVSLKLMIYHSADSKYRRAYAFLHTGALFAVFVGINVARLVQQHALRGHHEKRRLEDTIPMFGNSKIAWLISLICTASIIPLAYVTKVEKDDNPSLVLGLSVVFVAVLLLVEWIFKPPKSGTLMGAVIVAENCFTPEIASERLQQNLTLEEKRREIKSRPEYVHRLLPQRRTKQSFGEDHEEQSHL